MAKLHPMLEPFGSVPGETWDRVHAGHLLNRAAFGGTDAEVAEAFNLGPVGAIDKLLDFPDAPVEEISQTAGPDLSGIADYPKTAADRRQLFQGKTEEERKVLQQQIQQANNEAIREVAGWWMRRMAWGPYPVQEKLAFFWHGHFTTSARDERSAWLMWNQNETLRTYAAGNFAKFTKAIAHDPAMLDYLNNQQNKKAHPNENFARELMELFTLGIGNYTENDVKEGARAFTGWAHNGEQYVFRKFDHDDGDKVFLNRRGKFDGGDVVDVILQQPICGAYIASRLWCNFVNEDPDAAMCQSLGQVLRDNNYELRPALRILLSSRAFHSNQNLGGLIKSPVQLIVGLARQLGLDDFRFGRLRDSLKQMGQEPLMPPNVKGWPGGRQWINTSTLFVRQNTALQMVGDRGAKIRRNDGDRPEEIVQAWLARLIQRPVGADRQAVLVKALGTRITDESLRGMIGLIVSMPEFQLC